MKVFIGKYRGNFFGADIDKFCEKIGFSEKASERICDFLWFTCKIDKIATFWYDVYSSKRKVKIRVDKYDTYNFDNTLATIILPCLKQYRSNSFSIFIADKGDAPCTYYNDDFKRWEWIVDQMIYSFNEIANNPDGDFNFWTEDGHDKNGYECYRIRVDNGLRLFGRYYRNLWE